MTLPSTSLLADASTVVTASPTSVTQPAAEAVTDSTESSRCPSVPDMMVSILSSSIRVEDSMEHLDATSAAIAVTESGEQPPGPVAATDAVAVTVSTEPAPQLHAAVHVSSRTESTESLQVAADTDTVTESTEPPLQPLAESNESSTSEPVASGLPKEQEAFQVEADESRETSTAGLSKRIVKVSLRILLFGWYSFFVQCTASAVYNKVFTVFIGLGRYGTVSVLFEEYLLINLASCCQVF
jgi:hypothetical protein